MIKFDVHSTSGDKYDFFENKECLSVDDGKKFNICELEDFNSLLDILNEFGHKFIISKSSYEGVDFSLEIYDTYRE